LLVSLCHLKYIIQVSLYYPLLQQDTYGMTQSFSPSNAIEESIVFPIIPMRISAHSVVLVKKHVTVQTKAQFHDGTNYFGVE